MRGSEKSTTTIVELDLERMEKMKRARYGNVSVIELELALIEGLAKVREMGLKQTQEEDESVVWENSSNVLGARAKKGPSVMLSERALRFLSTSLN